MGGARVEAVLLHVWCEPFLRTRGSYGELRRPLSEVEGREQDFCTQAGLQVAELVRACAAARIQRKKLANSELFLALITWRVDDSGFVDMAYGYHIPQDTVDAIDCEATLHVARLARTCAQAGIQKKLDIAKPLLALITWRVDGYGFLDMAYGYPRYS